MFAYVVWNKIYLIITPPPLLVDSHKKIFFFWLPYVIWIFFENQSSVKEQSQGIIQIKEKITLKNKSFSLIYIVGRQTQSLTGFLKYLP